MGAVVPFLCTIILDTFIDGTTIVNVFGMACVQAALYVQIGFVLHMEWLPNSYYCL